MLRISLSFKGLLEENQISGFDFDKNGKLFKQLF